MSLPTDTRGVTPPGKRINKAGEELLVEQLKKNIGYPILVQNKIWYGFEEGCWQEKNREDNFAPMALQVIPPAERTARYAKNLLDHLETQSTTNNSFYDAIRFDRDDTLVNMGNGILRFKKLGTNGDKVRLEPWNPNLLFTKKLNVNYDPKAGCARFVNLLVTQLPDAADRKLFKLFFGSCLLPDSKRFGVCLVCYGETQTGKSTLVEKAIGNVFGPGNVTALTFDKICDVKAYELPYMSKAVVNIGGELKDKENDSTNFKCIVGGEKTVVRPIFGRPYEVEWKTKLVQLCNSKPVFKNGTQAELRRIRMIRFGTTIVEHEEGLYDRLNSEASGIFNWVVQGFLEVMQVQQMPHGGEGSQEVEHSFDVSNDPLKALVDTEFTREPDYFLTNDRLHNIAREFMIEHGMKVNRYEDGSPWLIRDLVLRYVGVVKRGRKMVNGVQQRGIFGLKPVD